MFIKGHWNQQFRKLQAVAWMPEQECKQGEILHFVQNDNWREFIKIVQLGYKKSPSMNYDLGKLSFPDPNHGFRGHT